MPDKNSKTGTRQITSIETVPFSGGCNTVLESEQIPMGKYSMVQNLRSTRPGKDKRKGQRKQHSTADGTNTAMTMYQFNKIRIAESHFFAQMSDSDVLEATNMPPVVTTGVFGTEAFSGSASPVPASWATIRDALIFSNGVDLPQIWYGDISYVAGFVHYFSDDVPPSIPEIGYDFTDEASDGRTDTYVDLSGMLVYESCAFIFCPVQANGIKFTVSSVNDLASVASLYYKKSDDSWTELTNGTHGFVDGTDVAGDTLKQTGTMSWTTQPTDEIPVYMFGQCGFWYQLRVSATLTNPTKFTAVQFTAPWQSIVNVWDGFPVPVLETQFYDDSAGVYKTYGATSIEIDAATTSDTINILTFDLANAVYVDVGETPNTESTTTVATIKYWNGIAFVTVGTLSDGTNGFANSGWITFPRQAAVKKQFNKNKHYTYVYQIAFGVATVSDDVIVSLFSQPYFDVNKFGKGYCNAAWKKRAVYGTDIDEIMYVSALGRPQVLNGDDFGILEPGDGRSNLPVAAKSFHNELIVWQEEKGKEGGCITLFEGFSPATYGKLLLSDKIGTLSAKTVVIVDGVYTSTKTDEVVGKTGFFLSHYGFFITDGRYVTGISDDIQNYFDPLNTECIRRGYDDQMWVGHDTAKNVIRVGLVSGISMQTATATATTSAKLTDSAGAFTTRKTVTDHPISHTIAVGDTVYNTTDKTSALITAVDSATALSIDTDIFTSGEGYEIYSATCNLFPVLDPVDKTWGFDLFQQSLSSFTEVEAGSGNVNVIQMVGGTKDGFIYQSNYGDNDISTAIDAYIDISLNSEGQEMELETVVLTAKTGTGVTITPSSEGVSGTAITETSLTRVRNRYSMNSKGMDISLKVQNKTAGESVHLFGVGMKIYSDNSR